MIENGADVNAKNFKLVTSLMFAAGIGDLETVKILIENGADINLKNKDGENALDIAINKGQKETAEFLKKLYE